jgi:hypothetical protein
VQVAEDLCASRRATIAAFVCTSHRLCTTLNRTCITACFLFDLFLANPPSKGENVVRELRVIQTKTLFHTFCYYSKRCLCLQLMLVSEQGARVLGRPD